MLSHLVSFSAYLALVAASIPQYSGYSVLWSDDFNGAAGARVNAAKWNYATPQANPGEDEVYTTSTANAQLSGSGAVQIIPLKSNSGQWTSARLESVQTFQSQAGHKVYVEAQIKMGSNPSSSQQGIWPAFWALGTGFRTGSTPWPTCGEWDIFETIDGSGTGYTTLHCGTYPGGICNEPVGLSSNLGYSPTSWNTWGFMFDRTSSNWQSQQLTWWLNDQIIHTITGAQVGDYNTWVQVSQNSFYLIANVAVGGAFPGQPTSATLGGINSGMSLNYVAVYKK